MTDDEIKTLISDDEDFVYLKRFDYSLLNVLERYSDGCPDRIIAQALCMTEEAVNEMYDSIILRLRAFMGVSDDLV
jgi:DNA-binding NarL/FixJ family response regulator